VRSPGKDADLKLWGIVAATVRPLRARSVARPRASTKLSPVSEPTDVTAALMRTTAAPVRPRTDPTGPTTCQRKPGVRPQTPPQAIEPGRRRRIDRGRDAPAAVIDLHGLSQGDARAALTGFILRGWADHRRTILVITGKGALGDGVLRRRVPEWLAEPPLRQVVAGLSEAHRRHGGEGALYVALKRAR